MARPLSKTYDLANPFVVERHDQDDGSITYEIWDTRPDTYRRLCSINEWNDGGDEDDEGRELSTAKADADMISTALNMVFGLREFRSAKLRFLKQRLG
jgi:hypothetical protein